MPHLLLRLFGAFSLTVDSRPVGGIAQTRLQDLLVYLFLHRQRAQPRATVASALWPETNDVQALKNLRTIYARLRDLLPQTDSLLAVDNQSMQWRGDANIQIDILDFEERLAHAERAAQAGAKGAVSAFEDALALYSGDLLPSDFAPWVVAARERLRQRWLNAHDTLVSLLLGQGEQRRALGYAQSLVRIDPLSEPAHMRQMEVLLAMGNRAGALGVYHECAKLLANELGVDPGAPLQRLYERVLFADGSEIDQSSSILTEAPPHNPSTSIIPAGTVVTVAQSRLVGRGASMDWLLDQWEMALHGQPRIALITGEAGIGKTRLAEEFAHNVRTQGDVLIARAFATSQIPYHALAEWLGSSVVTQNLSQVDPAWRIEASRLAPALAAGLTNVAPPEPISHSWQTHHFLLGLAELLVAGCTMKSPRVLLLDDVHWVDDETLEWLPVLLKAAAGKPLLLLMTARTEDIEANPHLLRTREALIRTGELSEHSLSSLDASETAAVASDLAGERLTLEAIFQLHRESEGNPLFIVEMLRSGFLAARGVHTDGKAGTGLPSDTPRAESAAVEGQSDEDGSDVAIDLPPVVAATLRTRLAQLSAGARTLAECAAVIGREVNFDLLAAVSHMEEDALLLRLDELWRRRILREQGNAEYDFTHDKLRGVAYANMVGARRRVLHRRVGDALVALPNAQTFAGQIALHYELAANLPLAVQWYRLAASEAARLYATAEATRIYQHLLAEPLVGVLAVEERGDIRLALARALTVLGRLREAKAHAELAIEDADALQDEARKNEARFERAAVMAALLEDHEALREFYALAPLFSQMGNRRLLMKSLSWIGQTEVYLGHYDAGSQAFAQTLEIAREVDDQVMLADTLAEQAWLEFDQWNLSQARPLALEAVTLLEKVGAKDRALWTALLLALAADAEGERWQWLLRARRFAQETESGEGIARASSDLGVLLADRGLQSQGMEIVMVALADALALDHGSNVAYGAENLGRVLLGMGYTADAEIAFRNGAAVCIALDASFLAARMLVRLVLSLLDTGRLVEAAATLEEAQALDFLPLRQYFLHEWFVFLATRLEYAQGTITAHEADQRLQEVLAQDVREELAIEVAYWRWRILPNEVNQHEATRTLLDRAVRWPQTTTRLRYTEITGVSLPEPAPLPDVESFVPNLQRLDALIARARELIAALEQYEVPR